MRVGFSVRKSRELDMLRRLRHFHVGRRVEWCGDRKESLRRTRGLNRGNRFDVVCFTTSPSCGGKSLAGDLRNDLTIGVLDR